MSKGGYRPGAGRPKGSKNKTTKKADITTVKDGAALENLTPLEYLLRVMNNPNEDTDRRMRAAIASLPFCHPRASALGKKEKQALEAEKASKGIFKPGKPLAIKQNKVVVQGNMLRVVPLCLSWELIDFLKVHH